MFIGGFEGDSPKWVGGIEGETYPSGLVGLRERLTRVGWWD